MASRSRVGTTSPASTACSRRAPAGLLTPAGARPIWRPEFEAIFSFLFDPTLDATNWRAEHALRPAVITRNMGSGGNRTMRGAHTQQVLASILRTAQQRDLDTTEIIARLLRAPRPAVLDALQSVPVIH